VTTRSKDYLIFLLVIAALVAVTTDRHWRYEASQQRLESAGEELRACQADLNYQNGKN